MAQPQPAPSVPEYPHPNDVEDAKRDAPTPEREGFDAIVVQPGQDIVSNPLLRLDLTRACETRLHRGCWL